ncbi:hypothetical protein O1L55_05530 [Streptomyces albulus]|nr:hypothetical protein [Streptomyces noursei]
MRTRLGEAITQRDTAAGAWDDAVATQADRLLAWAAGCTELIVADPGELAARAAVEADVRGWVDAAARPRGQEIATARALVLAARKKMWEERDTLDEEVRRLRGETELSPPAPRTRTTVRTAAAGAPLWRLWPSARASRSPSRPGWKPHWRPQVSSTPGSAPPRGSRCRGTTPGPRPPWPRPLRDPACSTCCDPRTISPYLRSR